MGGLIGTAGALIDLCGSGGGGGGYDPSS